MKFDGFALVDVQVRKPHGKSEQHQQQQKFELLSYFLHRESKHCRSCSIISSSSKKRVLAAPQSDASEPVLMSQCHICSTIRFGLPQLNSRYHNLIFTNSNRMKVSAASQLAVLKFVASQCHMSPDGSRFSLVLLKVKTPYVTKSYLQYLSCFSVWHVSQKGVAMSHYSSRKKSAASLFKDDAISSMTFLLFELYRRIIHDLQATFVTSNGLHLSPI